MTSNHFRFGPIVYYTKTVAQKTSDLSAEAFSKPKINQLTIKIKFLEYRKVAILKQ